MIFGKVKESYTGAEWSLREEYYIKQLDLLELPHDMTIDKVREMAAKVDGLRAEASIELAYCSRKFENLDRMKKLSEKELFLLIKSQGIPGLKTEAEVNGAVTIAMKDIAAADVLAGKGITLNLGGLITAMTPVNSQAPAATPPVTPTANTQVGLIPAIQIAESRMLFMEAILSSLKEKASTLITIEGALKLESDITRSSGGNTSAPADMMGN